MSAISNLKDALVTAAGNISWEIDRLECLADIDTWYATRTAADALSANEVTSYSIGGRSVTRQGVAGLRKTESELYGRIMARLYHVGQVQVDGRREWLTRGIV